MTAVNAEIAGLSQPAVQDRPVRNHAPVNPAASLYALRRHAARSRAAGRLPRPLAACRGQESVPMQCIISQKEL